MSNQKSTSHHPVDIGVCDVIAEHDALKDSLEFIQKDRRWSMEPKPLVENSTALHTVAPAVRKRRMETPRKMKERKA